MFLTQEQIASLPYTLHDPLRSPTVCLTLTDACNIQCSYCFNYVPRDNSQMRPDLAVAIVDFYYRYLGRLSGTIFCPQVIFFGGEPTLNSAAIFAVLAYLRTRKLDCVPRLVTNGILAPSLLDRLLEENLYFQLSYDGVGNALRLDKAGRASTDDLIRRTLRRVADAGLPIFLRATIHRENVHSMREIVAFARDHGVSTVAFSPVVLEGNAASDLDLRPDVDEYVESYFQALDLALETGINFYSAELYEFQRGPRPAPPVLVWLPDGQLTFTIKYASDHSGAAHQVMIGRYDLETEQVELYGDRIQELLLSFLANQNAHCSSCSAFGPCRGRRCFDLFATRAGLKQYDDYPCRITRAIVSRLSSYDLSKNAPF